MTCRAPCWAMSRLSDVTEPAGGEIASLHARKRLAFETLQHAERSIRVLSTATWPKLVIFDCDGVLVDSEPISLMLTRAALARYGLGTTEQESLDLFSWPEHRICAKDRGDAAGRIATGNLRSRLGRRRGREIRARTERLPRSARSGFGSRNAGLRGLLQRTPAHPGELAYRRLRRSVRPKCFFPLMTS